VAIKQGRYATEIISALGDFHVNHRKRS
jgi:hypothetical protein